MGLEKQSNRIILPPDLESESPGVCLVPHKSTKNKTTTFAGE